MSATFCRSALGILSVFFAGFYPQLHAEPDYAFRTIAGSPNTPGNRDGGGAQAQFGYIGNNNFTFGAAVDPSGNLFVSDRMNNTIRKVSASGEVTTVAGNAWSASGAADGLGSEARFYFPSGLATDAAGNVFVADSNNSTIRRISPDGTVTTIAGKAGAFGVVDGPAHSARFWGPNGLAVDRAGNVYVADTGNHAIRKITLSGEVVTVAGTPGQYNSGDSEGTGPAAKFWAPSALCVDDAGVIFVADQGNNKIKRITPEGVVTTLAGQSGSGGFADGAGVEAKFSGPAGIALTPTGDVLIADAGNHVIRKVTTGGVVTTLAGVPGGSFSRIDGVGSEVRFGFVSGLAVTSAGTILVVDSDLYTIVVRQGASAVPTAPAFLRQPRDESVGDGGDACFEAAASGFPVAIAYRWQTSGDGGSSWADLVADAHTIGVTSPKLVVNSVTPALSGRRYRCIADNGVGAGTSSSAVSLSVYSQPTEYEFSTVDVFTGGQSHADGIGGVARFAEPCAVSVDLSGTVFVVDSSSNIVRRMGSDGLVTTYAGMAWEMGATDGVGDNARFGYTEIVGGGFRHNYGPRGIAVNREGVVFVADSGNHIIRRIATDRTVTTFAGVALQSGSADGAGNVARFNNPCGLAADNLGNVYVADANNRTIRKISADGHVSTVAGASGQSGTADGPAAAARFQFPYSVALDNDGNIYVADPSSHVIRKIDGAGMVTTLAGTPGVSGWRDGLGSTALFDNPVSVAWTAGLGLSVVDSYNHCIRLVAPSGEVRSWVGAGHARGRADGIASVARFAGPRGIAFDQHGDAYVADTANQTIRKVSAAGVTTTLAGNAGGFWGGIFAPRSVAYDRAGNVYVICPEGNGVSPRLARVSPTRQVTFAPETDGFPYFHSVSIDAQGIVNVGAENGQSIYQFRESGESRSFDPGLPYSSITPVGIAVDSGFNLYTVNPTAHRILRTTYSGATNLIAGSYDTAGSVDGLISSARFRGPYGVAVSWDDAVYVADTGNHTIRKIAPDGTVTTIAGTALSSGSVDGIGGAARFNSPRGLAVDRSGVIYVADSGNQTIRRVARNGDVTTIGGFAGTAAKVDGTGSVSRFSTPWGIAVAESGDICVADYGNNVVRIGSPRTAPIVRRQPASATAVNGDIASFSVLVSGLRSLVFRWQASADSGATWHDLADGTGLSGSGTEALSVTASASLNGARFRCVVTNSLGTSTTASASLYVRQLLSAWRIRYWAEATGTGDAADSADPDGDGRANILEYAFGSNPLVRDLLAGFVAGTAADANGDHLTLTFDRIADPVLTYTVEASNDLVVWTSIWASTGAANLLGTVTATDSGASQQNNPRRFLRLRVSY